MGYSLWGHKELDMTEHPHNLFFFNLFLLIYLTVLGLSCGTQGF